MSTRYTGLSVRTVESLRLLTGRGQFVDDLKLPGMVAAHFLRSPYANARIESISLDRARSLPGVLGVWTGRELAGAIKGLLPVLEVESYTATERPNLAFDRIRFAGEAVAVIVASNRYVAEDAADLIEIDYQPFDPGSPANFQPGSAGKSQEQEDVLFRAEIITGTTNDAFRDADVHITRTFHHGRSTGLPMENRGVVAQYEGGRVLNVWSSTQIPHLLKRALADCLCFPEHRLRVIAPDVGGGFGVKMHIFPEEIVIPWLAVQLGTPVKWLEDRRENLMASVHAREHELRAELAAGKDGVITAVRVEDTCDMGAYSAYPVTCALEPLTCGGTLSGPYKIPNYSFRGKSVASAKCPTGAVRGVGFVLGTWVMESLIEELARELHMDPAEVRRRNMIPARESPCPSAGGMIYDSGDYAAALDRALTKADYTGWRERQKSLRSEGRYIGIGIASFIEPTGMGRKVFRKRGTENIPGFDSATIKMEPSGTVRAYVSTPSQGQGQETSFAQMLADELGMRLEDVIIGATDTAVCPAGSGTFACRSVVGGGSALVLAARDMRQKLLTAAGHLLRIPSDQLQIRGGRIAAADGRPGMSVAELARKINSPLHELPPEVNLDLEITRSFSADGAAVSYGSHVVVVEVDCVTGRVNFLRYVVAEDCGQIVNPGIVDGQIRGAIVQGIGATLLEQIVYGEEGQMLTGTLMDYLAPSTIEAVPIEIEHLCVPSPLTPTGSKGVAESGIIAAPAAIRNAIADAMEPFHASFQKLPITPEEIVAATRQFSRSKFE